VAKEYTRITTNTCALNDLLLINLQFVWCSSYHCFCVNFFVAWDYMS